MKNNAFDLLQTRRQLSTGRDRWTRPSVVDNHLPISELLLIGTQVSLPQLVTVKIAQIFE